MRKKQQRINGSAIIVFTVVTEKMEAVSAKKTLKVTRDKII
jgi:hypothetical protein